MHRFDDALTIPAGFEELRLNVPVPLVDPRYDRLAVSHLARSTYLRMWAPILLGQRYDRLLYLDSDIFADAGGLSRLFEVDMRGQTAGCGSGRAAMVPAATQRQGVRAGRSSADTIFQRGCC